MTVHLRKFANLFLNNKFGKRLFRGPDIYITSYPKSGRTWLRSLIGKYLSLKYKIPEDLILVTPEITRKCGLPIVEFSHDGAGFKKKLDYSELSFSEDKFSGKKVIFLARNIKDTLVSAYFQATKRENVFHGTISEFISSEKFGIMKIISFYKLWLENRHVAESFLVITYEDLHKDVEETAGKVLKFIGEVEVDADCLQKSIEFCSFANLKKLESQNRFDSPRLSTRNPEDPESYKVRKGQIGGHHQYLSSEDIRLIDQAIEEQGFDLKNFLLLPLTFNQTSKS